MKLGLAAARTTVPAPTLLTAPTPVRHRRASGSRRSETTFTRCHGGERDGGGDGVGPGRVRDGGVGRAVVEDEGPPVPWAIV